MVKSEIFGSRNSKLIDKIPKDKSLKLIDNLWFCTCLYKFNKNPQTRYIIFYECFSEEQFNIEDVNYLKSYFKSNVSLFKAYITESNIEFLNIYTGEKVIFEHNPEGNNPDAARFILSQVDCLCGNLNQANTSIIKNDSVSKFSIFLRRNLYGRLGTTDIDFVINLEKQIIFIEEKLYMEETGGSIGLGAYISFNEILRDVVKKDNFHFWIMFFNNLTGEWYKYDFLKEPQQHEKIKDQRRNETRVLLKYTELEKVDINNFIEGFKND